MEQIEFSKHKLYVIDDRNDNYFPKDRKEFNLEFIREHFPQLFDSVRDIIRNRKNFNLIDRYFYFHNSINYLLHDIENDKEIEKSDKQNLKKYFSEILHYNSQSLKIKILLSHGILNIETYLNSEKVIVINNPNLFSFVCGHFKKEEIRDIIFHDLVYSLEFHYEVSVIESKFRIAHFDYLYRMGTPSDDDDIKIIKSLSMGVSYIKKILGVDIKNAKIINKKNLKIYLERKHLPTFKLSRGLTQKKLIDKMTFAIGKDTGDEPKPEIKDAVKSFIYKYFKNSHGKSGKYINVGEGNILNDFVPLLKKVLIDNLKKIAHCKKKDIAIILEDLVDRTRSSNTIEKIKTN